MASKRKASFGTPSLFNRCFRPIENEEEPITSSGVEPTTGDEVVSRTSFECSGPTAADEAESGEMDVRGAGFG